MATIGLKDVHYALLTTDPISGSPTYGTPVKIKGAMSANINPNTSTATIFYDDGPGDVATTMGEISLELNLADIPLEVQAILLGNSFENGLLKCKADDVPPLVAIGFRTLKSNGRYRYIWLTKGKFALPEEEYSTKGDSVEFKTPTITGAFMKRDCDGEWKRVADEDAEGYVAGLGAMWFTSPLTPSVAPTYSITYAKGTETGATGLPTATTGVYGSEITISATIPTASGKTFGGWTTDFDSNTYQAGNKFTMPNKAVTLTAKWS